MQWLLQLLCAQCVALAAAVTFAPCGMGCLPGCWQWPLAMAAALTAVLGVALTAVLGVALTAVLGVDNGCLAWLLCLNSLLFSPMPTIHCLGRGWLPTGWGWLGPLAGAGWAHWLGLAGPIGLSRSGAV